MTKRIISLSIMLSLIALGFLQKKELLYLVKQEGTLSIFICIFLIAICVFFPVIPFPVLAGMAGAAFGASKGALISLVGSMFGTMGFFFLSRYGFRDWVQENLTKYSKMSEYEEILNRNSFVAIFTCRLIPIIPALVVNIICGLSHVNWIIFLIASTLGKIPNILILSFTGSIFSNNKFVSLGIYGSYLLIILLINFAIIYQKNVAKRQRQGQN